MKNTNNLNKSRLMRLIIAGVIVTITLLTLIMSIGESNVNASAASTSTGVTIGIEGNEVGDNSVYGKPIDDSVKRYITGNNFSSGANGKTSYPVIQYNKDGEFLKYGNPTASGYVAMNTVGGVVIGDNSCSVVASGMTVNANGELIINTPAATAANGLEKTALYLTFGISEKLRKILKDPLIEVQITPYVYLGSETGLSDTKGSDSVMLEAAYCNGTNPSTGASIKKDLVLPGGEKVIYGAPKSMASGEYSSDSFMQVTLSQWKAVETHLSVRIKEIGIRVEIMPNYSVIINQNQSTITVTGDNRHPNADPEYATSGNTVTCSLVIQDSGENLTLDTNPYNASASTYTTGTAFREYFLDHDEQTEGGEDEYIITWEIEGGNADRLPSTSDKSGQTASYLVYSGSHDTNELTIRATLSYRNGSDKEEIGEKRFVICIDNDLPNRPELADNTFFEKYLEVHSFYTDPNGQELSPVTNKPVKLNLLYASGSSTTDGVPYLSDKAMDIMGGSPMVVYYKTTYVGPEIPDRNVDKVSSGFDISTANDPDSNTEDGSVVGIFCTVYEGNYAENAEGMFLELFEVIDGTSNNITTGVWSIELVACDYVGNQQFYPNKYFIRVDVADYVFTVKYVLGSDEDSSVVNRNLIETSYATINDSGKVSSYQIMAQNELTLRRGAMISFRLKFRTTQAFNSLILTQFVTKGVNMDCRKCTYSNNTTQLNNQFDEYNNGYTFIVGDSFVSDPTSRVLSFKFKSRVEISVANGSQMYDGNSKTVTAQPNINGSLTNSVRVTVTYYTDSAMTQKVNENNSNYPTSAGTYYYFAEIVNNTFYYGSNSGSFTINKSTPNINTLMQNSDLSIVYGESMAAVDMDWSDTGKDENGKREVNGRILAYYQSEFVSELSSNGVPGYYELSEETRALDAYARPNAGSYEIQVVFHAVLGTVLGTKVNYEYDANGEFILNPNYEPATKSITLYVKHDTNVSFTLDDYQGAGSTIVDGRVEHVYNGAYKTVNYTVKSTREDELGLILTDDCITTYATMNSLEDEYEDLRYTINQPINAGIYVVKVVISKANCNYTGTYYFFMVIHKVELTVSGKQETFDYQYESIPSATATLDQSDLTSKIKFVYTFYYYDLSLCKDETQDIGDMLVDSNIVAKEDMRNLVNLPESAGKYVVKIEVDDPNYQGTGRKLYTINKAGNDSAHVNVIWPNVYSSTVSNEYNISYGQPLKAIRISDTYAVKYSAQVYITPTRKTTTTVNVTGKMVAVYCKYEDWVDEQLALGKQEDTLTREAYVAYMQEYKDAEYSLFPYSWFICFVADDSKNYDFLYGVQEIFVGKANLDWSKVVIDNVEYESTVEDIDDLTISKTVGILYSSDNSVPADESMVYYKKSNSVYLYVDPSKYVYALNTTVNVIAGVTNVEIALTHEDKNNYKDVYANSCLLTVDKKRLTVAFNSQDTYSTTYKVYQEADLYNYLIYSGSKNENLPRFSGTFVYENNGEEVNFSNLVAGDYTVTYAIDNANYEGTVTFPITINKSKLSVTQLPEIANENNVVYYDNALSTVTFYNGTFIAEGGETVSGRFSLSAVHNGETFGNAGLSKNIYFNFTPTDTNNYEIFNGSDDNGGYVVRIINKADVSHLMNIEVVGTYYYGDLSYSAGKEKADFFDTGVVSYAFDNSSGKFTNLAWNLNLGRKDGEILPEGKLTAGNYVFTAMLDASDLGNANYKGSVSVGFTVNKKFAVLKVVETSEKDQICIIDGIEGVKKPYAGKSLSVGVRAYAVDDLTTPINESIYVDYRVNNSSLGYTPGEIGYYECVMSFTASMNYTLVDNEIDCNPVSSARSFLMISIDTSDVKFVNLSQIYTVQKIVNVDLGKNVAECALTYEDINTGVKYDTIPVNAGKYEVYMNFYAENNNGYHEVIKASTLNPNFVLVINKYVADVTVSDVVSITYTGKEVIPFEAYTSPYGLGLEYAYKQGDGEYKVSALANLGALDADTYQVLITVNDNNYKGEKVITLVVQKAGVSITIAPEFNNYVYNTSDAPTVKEDGKVYCRYDDKEVEGTFYIELDRINTLNVGTHEVVYNFHPTSGNYLDTTGNTTITIDKRVLDDDFLYIYVVDGINLGSKILESEVYAVEYDNTYHYVEVSYDDSLLYNYAVSNNDFTVSVSYNSSANRPRAKGSYVVSAVVSSKNYICQRTWDYEFEVTQCTPYITSLPTTDKVFKIGDEITTADISGGRAVIKNTGAFIAGTFRVENTIFTKANSAKINVTFTPTDTLLYKEITFAISVNVIGKDSLVINNNVLSIGSTASGTDWTDYANGEYATSFVIIPAFSSVMATSEHDCGVRIVVRPTSGENSLDYGATLGEFTVSFVPVDVTCDTCNGIVNTLNNCGTLEFKQNASYVPCVGEKIEVVYKLISGKVEDFETYNVMSGYVSFDGIVDKVDLTEYSAELLIFEENFTSTSDYIFNVYDKKGSMIVGIDNRNGTITLDGAIIYTDTILTVNVEVNGDNYATSSKINVSLSTINYDFDGEVNVKRYVSVAESDILVVKTFKAYDGKAISPEDLDITVRNSQLEIDDSAFSVKIYDSLGNESQGTEIGTYSVVIYLKDDINQYYGTKTVEFIITKRDVSEELSLVKDKDIYNSSTVNVVTVKWLDTVLSAYQYSLEFKKASAPDGEYLPNIVFNAGVYHVKVTVNTEFMSGVAVLEYTVSPKSVTLVTGQSSYVYVYGTTIPAPEVGFIDTDTKLSISLDYQLYYHSSSVTQSTVLPESAGDYVVTVKLADTNYTVVNNEFAFIINPKSVTLIKVPSALFTTDETSSYNLKYGQKFGELRLDNSGKVTSSDIDVAGTFKVINEYIDVIPDAGNKKVTLIFIPNNSNYSSVTCEITVVVAKATATVTFTTLSAKYNGASKASDIKYNVTPSNVPLKIEYKGTTGNYVTDPVSAGNYELRVTSLDTNYEVKVNATANGSAPIFVIYKAIPRNVIDPTSVSISVGESLGKSALGGGEVYYEGFNNAIQGTFDFVQSSLVFTESGLKTVQYKFIPTDGVNFATHVGYVDIMINKGIATILVTSNNVEYGTPADFTQLVFVTAPSHLSSKVVYDTTYEGKKYNNGEIISAGTYYFTCWIEDDNYTSEVYEFSYVVNKKVIDIEFVNSEGKEVTTYTTAYGKKVDVNVTMYDANHVGDKRTYLMRDADSMYKTIIYRYTSRTGPHYDSFVAPSDIETYDLTVTLVHDNYVATRTIIYKVTKGTVENIEFHQETLMEQTYGSVVAPIITTTPAGVSYYIVYQGFNTTMPTDAGTYNITVYIDDENYEADQISAVFMIKPKELVISDIVVKDKVYDGTSTVEISGRLDGMLYGDEVLLRMEATTFDNKTNVGKHYVTITNYVISGLQSTNYALKEPVCDKQITIYNNKVQDKQSSSYILSTKNGFASGTTVEFNTMKLESNQTSIWTKMLGVEARAVAYNILVNDNPTINSDQYKICIEIPKKYLDKEFTVKFDGALLGQNVSYTREGNYLTFYASSSTGTVVFELAEFNYTYVVILASLAIILIAIVVVLILNPLQHRRKVTAKETEKSAINYIKKNS